jgi:hypothetical protein
MQKTGLMLLTGRQVIEEEQSRAVHQEGRNGDSRFRTKQVCLLKEL